MCAKGRPPQARTRLAREVTTRDRLFKESAGQSVKSPGTALASSIAAGSRYTKADYQDLSQR